MSWSWKPDPAIVSTMVAAASKGVAAGAEVIFYESQGQVPVDKGDLKASGRVDARGTKARIVYSDPIAVIAHENLVVSHRTGRSKFLESAMNSKRDEAAAAIAETIRRAIH